MPHVIAFVDDLMSLTRIREAARDTGADVRPARTAADLVEGARSGARLVLVDADSTRLPWAEALAALRRAGSPELPVVAFLSHVHTERAETARLAGCTRVLARSAFVQELPQLVAAAARPIPEEPVP